MVGDEHVWTKDVRYQLSVSHCCSVWNLHQTLLLVVIIGLCLSFKPFNHAHKVAKFCYADKVG